MAQLLPVGHGLLIIDDSWSHSVRHTKLGRMSPNKWPARRRDLCLTPHSTQKRKHPCPRRDANPQSQQASGHRPTPLPALPLGLVRIGCRSSYAEICFCEGGSCNSHRKDPGWNAQMLYWKFWLLSKPSSDSGGNTRTLFWIRLPFTI